MIILDTNVLFELFRPTPDRNVLAWLDAPTATEIATTAITAAELLYGVERLPDGKRKAALREGVRQVLDEDFEGRIETFDKAAAEQYSMIVAERDRLGRPISTGDAQIASIARRLGATLATRNTKDFEDTGIKLIDPWGPTS